VTSSQTGDGAFYDRLADRFGGYHVASAEPYAYRFPDGSPEDAFDALVERLVPPEARGLEVGCADAFRAFRIARLFTHLTGIDVSEGMLAVARTRQTELGITNMSFEFVDGEHTPYPDASFDLVYSRRGPTFYREFARLLRPGGVYAEIQIGDRDTRDLKETFGRGQDFGTWDQSFLTRNVAEISAAGLDVVEAREFVYDDYYRDIEHLSYFLEGVPIFTDYDPAADRPLLQRYVDSHSCAEGVVLERHRLLIAARKPAHPA
jgi:SAM-dependent methyltransferase